MLSWSATPQPHLSRFDEVLVGTGAGVVAVARLQVGDLGGDDVARLATLNAVQDPTNLMASDLQDQITMMAKIRIISKLTNVPNTAYLSPSSKYSYASLHCLPTLS